MMDVPLTITSIMRYGTSVFGDREVVTWTGDGTRRRTYAEAGRRAARLANALRRLGVDADQRVGTFMWNNAEHLEAYLAVPSMGAVLHTLNIRLAAAEVGYIATHAEDSVVILDASLVSRFAEILPHALTVKHVIVTGGPLAETPGADQLTGVSVHGYEDLLAAEADSFDWPSLDERSAAAMCYTSGTTGHPKGIVYSHRSSYLHSMGACLGNAFALSERDRVLPVVPMFHAKCLGPGLRLPAVRRRPDHARPGPAAGHAGLAHRRRTCHRRRRGADDLGGCPGAHAGRGRRPVPAPPGHRGRLRGAACHAGQVRNGARRAAAAGLGHDRDVATGQRGEPAARRQQRGGVVVPGQPGPAVLLRRGQAGRGRRGAAAERRRGGRRDRGARPLDHRLLLQGRRPGQVPWRLAAYRRCGHDGRARLYPADRPGQGRDQVRRRMDLLDGTREHPDGPSRRGRGRGDRGRRRQVGRAATRGGGAAVRCGGIRREIAGLHDRADPALAASRALVLRRRSAQDQRR